ITLQPKYDVAIIGGGLAGLSLSIQLARKGYSVVLFEKEKYPFHKVCGEYISFESWDFLHELGVPLQELNLPKIDTLEISAPNGNTFSTPLPLGGFGISRYILDHLLAAIAIKEGVVLLEETKVESVEFTKEFQLYFISKDTTATTVKATVCCGSFGKRSNIDVKWKRSFITKKDPRINNYVGVKYHVKTDLPQHLIGLHNFKNGYCGISKIEEDKYCLCYLTTADNLKKCKGSIDALQQDILFQNPVLKSVFQQATFEEGFPVTIAQISFAEKSRVEEGVLLLGDAAGMIAPLCGNGMSMALHSSKIAFNSISAFLKGTLSRAAMEATYEDHWKKEFKNRLATGRMLQRFFGSKRLSNLFIGVFKMLPFLAKGVIKKTHGKPF
ncbi:MAG TPA: NAD(P)/FAD-dependent oxidoreductase, partial [Chitinophagaceae bacterium]|nr:NAD(P)/FAD-dependent oxidoreductase [Chitinophagaceae bacterium]